MRRTPRTEFRDARSAAVESRAAELMDRYRAFAPRWVTGMPYESPQTMYDPITWPDEGYPCQLCWAVKRWPWEPMRSCPISVDVESTYCEKHGGQPARMTWGRATWVDAGTIANLDAPSPTSTHQR